MLATKISFEMPDLPPDFIAEMHALLVGGKRTEYDRRIREWVSENVRPVSQKAA